MIEGIHYYIDPKGKWVFTAAYHEARGYCCGEACKHCPFDYEAVPEPIKTRAQIIKMASSQISPALPIEECKEKNLPNKDGLK